jgi:hypothetical protein
MGSIIRTNSMLLENALGYWNRIRGGRRLPLRADFDPSEVPALLPYVIVIDVLRDPADFRYRLLGTALDRVLGGDYRGRRYSELAYTKPGTPIWDEHCRVVAEQVPLRSTVAYVGTDRAIQRADHVMMPFSDAGETVDMLLAVVAVKLRPSAMAVPALGRRATAKQRA